MTEADASITDEIEVSDCARSDDDPAVTEVPLSRSAAGLSRQITALQRTQERLAAQVTRALRRGEKNDAAATSQLVEKVKERKALYQALLDRELRND